MKRKCTILAAACLLWLSAPQAALFSSSKALPSSLVQAAFSEALASGEIQQILRTGSTDTLLCGSPILLKTIDTSSAALYANTGDSQNLFATKTSSLVPLYGKGHIQAFLRFELRDGEWTRTSLGNEWLASELELVLATTKANANTLVLVEDRVQKSFAFHVLSQGTDNLTPLRIGEPMGNETSPDSKYATLTSLGEYGKRLAASLGGVQ